MTKPNRVERFQSQKVSFKETISVEEGVECDVYTLDGDQSRDLAIITVTRGHKTPLQRVLHGTSTIEGHLEGKGTLVITDEDDKATIYQFDEGAPSNGVEVPIGQTMQWSADPESDLTFYEICTPPYEDGRFENL